MKQINLLISTIDNRILGLKKIIKDETVIYTVSHQVTSKLSEETLFYIEELQKKSYVIYSQIHSKGVAKNRNNALKHRVKGSICLLCDDDVVYFEDSFEKLRDAFKDDSLEFLTFKIKTFAGKDYKKYKDYEFTQSLRTLTSIGIVDVAFREEVIEKYALEFDERFGPGGYYAIGEDFIFMSDANKKRASIVYKPLEIVQHEELGTGSTLEDKIIFGRGAMFARIFGMISVAVNTLFAIKHYKRYKKKYTFLNYWKLLNKGTLDFYKKHNN